MDARPLNAADFIDTSASVLESANAIGREAARILRDGGCVVLSVRGVRGVPSSFFNVVLSLVAEALANDFSDGRFAVETDTKTQRMVYERSLEAVSRAFHQN